MQGEKPRELYIPPEPSNDENEIFGTGITSGINFDNFDKIKVKVAGDNPCPPLKTFEESKLREFLLGNVTRSGYTKPTPIQRYAIPNILAKRDLMACAQTGSGKTAAFLLPMLHTMLEEGKDVSVGKPQAVILSPTRELAIQIFNEARKFAMSSYLKICIAYGGTASRHQGEKINVSASTWVFVKVFKQFYLISSKAATFWFALQVVCLILLTKVKFNLMTFVLLCWTRLTGCWTWDLNRPLIN